MSGGQWDYCGSRIQDGLETVSADQEALAHWPVTTRLLKALAQPLYDVEHDMDWALSGDTLISDADDIAMAAKIVDAVLKACPDAWFPRGKWATIQAVQDRALEREQVRYD